ncbi:MAG: acyl-CoA dehydrogenase family protein, partial [Ornithinimicrobium sp.]
MFDLSSDHEDFRALVRDFAQHEVEPHVAEWDQRAHF